MRGQEEEPAQAQQSVEVGRQARTPSKGPGESETSLPTGAGLAACHRPHASEGGTRSPAALSLKTREAGGAGGRHTCESFPEETQEPGSGLEEEAGGRAEGRKEEEEEGREDGAGRGSHFHPEPHAACQLRD